MKENPYVDSSGWDQITQTHHCIDCLEPTMVRGTPVKDFCMMRWQHYGIIFYYPVMARNETGHTIEGVIEKPARRALALIPHQTHVQYCLDCIGPLNSNGCASCGKEVDLTTDHSTLETIDIKANGTNSNFRSYVFHHDCLPPVFTHVRQYKEKYK